MLVKQVEGDETIGPFISDMAERLLWADLVICRAGALTIAELSNAGLASVLVPFPYAVDDHQTENANWLVEERAAILMPQAELSPSSLAKVLLKFFEDRSCIVKMSDAAKSVAKPDATLRFKQICLEVANV